MLVQSTFFWYYRIPELLSTSLYSIDFNFSSDRSNPIFLLLILGFIQYLAIYCSTSYFWCVIFRFRSRGGRMITSLNWTSTPAESHCLGHLVPILCPYHLGHLITWGIWFPSYVPITWGISSLGASCPPLSGIFVIYFIWWSADQIL